MDQVGPMFIAVEGPDYQWCKSQGLEIIVAAWVPHLTKMMFRKLKKKEKKEINIDALFQQLCFNHGFRC